MGETTPGRDEILTSRKPCGSDSDIKSPGGVSSSTFGLLASHQKGASEGNAKLSSLIITDANHLEPSRPEESMSWRLSELRSLGMSKRQSPKGLANKLEKSIATLMKHFNDQIHARANEFAYMSPKGDECNANLDMNLSTIIPNDVWDAVADIDLVRKELLTLYAVDCLEKSD